MKNSFLKTLLIPALAALFLFSACTENPIPSESYDFDSYQSQQFSYLEYDVFADVIQDATVENEMVVRPPDDRGKPNPRPVSLILVLRLMQLTEEQRAEVAGYLEAQRECTKAVMMRFAAQQRQMIANVNEARKGIIEDMRNGQITREEAQTQLRALNQRFQNAMMELRMTICEALKECHKALLDAISNMDLTEEQRAIWDRYIASLPEVKCGPPVRDEKGRGDDKGKGDDKGRGDDKGKGDDDEDGDDGDDDTGPVRGRGPNK